jgi:tetratricopeptide (TPR) repeat protein
VANLFDNKDRRVVPNWRSFGKTTVLGELNSIYDGKTIPSLESSIDDYVIDWRINKTVIHAADLLSAALVNNHRENKFVTDAAEFILNNKDKATMSQIDLAKLILKKAPARDLNSLFTEVNLDSLPKLVNPILIRERVKETRSLLRLYPRNPILLVELSRYYSILGQEEQSIKAMKNALFLAPNNRFVLRCATRLFAHFDHKNNDYLSFIHGTLKKSPLTGIDPWLTSAEISVATILNKTSRFIKKGIELINSKNIAPLNFTELASSIGTVELLNGSLRKGRAYFNKSLISPNDNSLAQLEWASTMDKGLDINTENFDVKMNFEAMALDSLHNNEFEVALDQAAKWFIDMPFSKRPIMFGSHLASSILKDQKKSISFLKAGLIGHPNDPQIINNLAYSYAIEDQTNEAFEELNKVKNEYITDDATQICLTATKGLAYFRSGFIDLGRDLYLEAIELTKKIGDPDLNRVAILNYAREEIRIKSPQAESIMEVVALIPDDAKEIEIRILKQDVVALYQKFKADVSA